MFAIALWDREKRLLHLARDRVGEKPLYYGWSGNSLVFGSELKALTCHPQFVRKISSPALTQYMRFSYVPAPLSIWLGVYKLEPGCILTMDEAPPPNPPEQPIRPGGSYGGISISRYWSLAEVTENGARDQIVDEEAAISGLEAALDGAVRRQMISDVPLGAFLSGGVDSSVIVALMQRHSTTAVRTFTIGFEETDFDESPHARAVARHLGTDHTEIPVTAAEAQAVIPYLPVLFDEPFADASQIPTHLVCKAARPHVKVALTGDAGDELFGGYTRYVRVPKVWRYFRSVPFPLRRALGAGIASLPVSFWDAPAFVRDWLKGGVEASRHGDRILRVGTRLSKVRDIDDLYLDLLSAWFDPAMLIALGHRCNLDVPTIFTDPYPEVGTEHPAARMMYQDAMTYLPDDILCKVDRAAMGVSLETRAPLLDPDVVAFSCQLPMSMKMRGNEGKWALRQVLYKYVPRKLIERPKVGFYLPIGRWLRGPLRDWAESLLAEKRLLADGIFWPVPIRDIWAEHLSGKRDWTARLWTVLMFQVWLDANVSNFQEPKLASDGGHNDT